MLEYGKVKFDSPMFGQIKKPVMFLISNAVFIFLLNAILYEVNCWRNDRETIMITERADKKSGIVKRAIMIGDKVCGKEGFIGSKQVKSSKRQDIDLNSLHRDLHPEQNKDEVGRPVKLIKNKENAPAVVVSKLSQQPGWFARLNRCCIDHENCDKYIPAKNERFGFKNEKEYTVYDCKCDDAFAECLKYADSHTADAVGDLYFNVLKMPCINFGTGENSTTMIDQGVMEKVDKLITDRLNEKTKTGEENGKGPTKVPTEESESKSENEGDEENAPNDENGQRSINAQTLSDATERQAIHFKNGRNKSLNFK